MLTHRHSNRGCCGVQVGVTDSEDDADTAEDLERIEAAAAAISQRLEPSSAQDSQEIQVTTVSLPLGRLDDKQQNWSCTIFNVPFLFPKTMHQV